jgi:hypothetical protein
MRCDDEVEPGGGHQQNVILGTRTKEAGERELSPTSLGPESEGWAERAAGKCEPLPLSIQHHNHTLSRQQFRI